MDNELQLITRIRSGDSNAFELLMHAYEKKVYSMALRMSGSAEDAFDLSQEIFLRIYRSIGLFKMESSVSTWIYRLSTNVCIDFLRRRKKRPETALISEQEDGEYENEIPDTRYSPESEYDKTELREQLSKALLCLSPEHRQIVVLRDINGLSYTEIADLLGIEEGTVKSRLFRAREQLRRQMAVGNNPASASSNRAEKR
jgi:RNA polymerase sigma-70 factor (ECF subfamily)